MNVRQMYGSPAAERAVCRDFRRADALYLTRPLREPVGGKLSRSSRCRECGARVFSRYFSVSDFPCQISCRAALCHQGESADVPSRQFGRDLCLVCVGILYGPGVGARLLGHGLAYWFGGLAPALSLSGAVMIPSKPNLGIAVAKLARTRRFPAAPQGQSMLRRTS